MENYVEKVLWKQDLGDGVDRNYLIDPVDIEERVDYVNYGSYIAIEFNKPQEEDALQAFIERLELEAELLAELDEQELAHALTEELGYDVEVFALEDYPSFDNDVFVFNQEDLSISRLDRGSFGTAKVYEYDNNGDIEQVVLHNESEIEEIHLRLTGDSVSLDDWDGQNYVTGGPGLHQDVYKVIASDMMVADNQPDQDLYLIEKSSQWVGSQPSGEILNEGDLVAHLEQLGRDVGDYMATIKTLDGSVYEPEKEVKKEKKQSQEMER